MAIDQRSAGFALGLQKWAQVVLAVLLTGFFVLLLPGGPPFGVPLGCLYIAWAIRASSENRFSTWLAFLLTLALAVLGGFVVVRRVTSLLGGQAVSPIDFSIELTLVLIAATVVVLHAINWRWLLSPGART